MKNALPGEAATIVHQYVLSFAEQAARLTTVSIVIIVITAALAIATVDREINLIWGIRRGRRWPRRIATYLLVMTARAGAVGASISLTTWLIGESLGAVIPSRTLGRTVFRALPFLFATDGPSLLYKAVPARQVPVLPAAIGGAAAALALEAAKYALRVVRRQSIDVRGRVRRARRSARVPVVGSSLLDHRARGCRDQRHAGRGAQAADGLMRSVAQSVTGTLQSCSFPQGSA